MDYVKDSNPASDVSLMDVAAMVWRRKWVVFVVVPLAIGITLWITSRLPRKWRASAQIVLLQRVTGSSSAPEALYMAPLVENMQTQVAMIESPGMALRTIDWLKNQALSQGKSLEDIGFSAEGLFKDYSDVVSVRVPKDSNLIEVTAVADRPDRAVTLANAVCKAFEKWKDDLARSSVQEMVDNLEQRTRRAREQMLDAERRETLFKQSHKLVDIPAQQQAALSRYQQQDAEVAGIRQEIVSLEARLRALEGRLREANEAVRSSASVAEDGAVGYLQAQLNQLLTDRAKLLLRYNPEYPDVKALDAVILDVKERLAKAIQASIDQRRPVALTQPQVYEEYKQAQTQLSFTRAKLAAAAALRDQLKRDTQGLPSTSMQYVRLRNDAELNRSLYTSLQAALNAAKSGQDLIDGNVKVTSEASTPLEPFLPDVRRNLLTGGILGLIASFAMALLIDYSDRRVRSVRHLRQMIPGPVVGTLPRLSRAELRDLTSGELPPHVQEAYGLARANLSLAVRRSQGEAGLQQVILVTSAVPGEGKSLTAMQLARSFARAGRSVALVDADLRRPTQNRLFGTEEPLGLADVLTDRVSLNEALVASDMRNLWVLHSGSASHSPEELLARPRMAEILGELRREASVVILDAPACAVFADALMLASHADCILHVVGVGQVDMELMQGVTQALSAAAPKAMVYLINKAPRERRHAYGDYYAYRYSNQNAQRED
jgi:capsular exopolysaccharide synthesis family protein